MDSIYSSGLLTLYQTKNVQFVQIETCQGGQTEQDLQPEICPITGRKDWGKRRKCWSPVNNLCCKKFVSDISLPI